ncbi:MAG: hypothetical protein HDR80_06485 [Bacteroides sp.]|nr:hypothetical protein [Bacteroides sp.]
MHPLISRLPAEKVICLDAEFANDRKRSGEDMLELSVMDGSGSLTYTSRYRPARLKKWGLEPHNITPEMVADAPKFADCRKEVQKMLDAADFIIGFAIANDVRILRQEGIMVDDAKIIELRDWFWFFYGRHHGLDHEQNINNSSVAGYLGADVKEELLHGSAYDAQVTLDSFDRLLHLIDTAPGDTLADVHARFVKEFEVAFEQYRRDNAAGYCLLELRDDGSYKMKATKFEPEPSDSIVAVIRVADRKVALRELGLMLVGEARKSSFTVPRLTERQLRRFRSYTNDYSPESSAFKSGLADLMNRFSPRR